jgi:hypothetical protein
MKLLSVETAAGTAHTNSTDEAVLGSYTFPAYFWQPGKVVKARAAVRATATNSTDTLTCYVRFGAAALTGTAIYTSAAVDVADDDIFVADIQITCRDADASSTLVCSVIGCNPDATGEAADIEFTIVSTVDTTAATYLGITGDWSVASASNSCQLEALSVFEAA